MNWYLLRPMLGFIVAGVAIVAWLMWHTYQTGRVAELKYEKVTAQNQVLQGERAVQAAIKEQGVRVEQLTRNEKAQKEAEKYGDGETPVSEYLDAVARGLFQRKR